MYVRNAEGQIMHDANTGYRIYDYGDGESTNFTRNFMSMSNPMSSFLYDTEEYLMDILNGKWYAKVDILDGLSLTASLGLHVDNTRLHIVGNKYYGQSASQNGSVQQYSSRTYSLDQQYLLTYKKHLMCITLIFWPDMRVWIIILNLIIFWATICIVIRTGLPQM